MYSGKMYQENVFLVRLQKKRVEIVRKRNGQYSLRDKMRLDVIKHLVLRLSLSLAVVARITFMISKSFC